MSVNAVKDRYLMSPRGQGWTRTPCGLAGIVRDKRGFARAVPWPTLYQHIRDRVDGMDSREDRQTLGEAIKVRRRELGWSQEELARRMLEQGDATFRQSDVSRLERGKVVLPH